MQITDHLGLARLAARRLYRKVQGIPFAEYEELEAEAMLLLCEAWHDYDSTKGSPSTFFLARIGGNLRHYLRDVCQPGGMRTRYAQERKMLLPTLTASEAKLKWVADTDSPRRIAEWEDARETIEEALSVLPERKRWILRQYFVEGKTQVQIGQELGITQHTVAVHIKNSLKVVKENCGAKN